MQFDLQVPRLALQANLLLFTCAIEEIKPNVLVA